MNESEVVRAKRLITNAQHTLSKHCLRIKGEAVHNLIDADDLANSQRVAPIQGLVDSIDEFLLIGDIYRDFMILAATSPYLTTPTKHPLPVGTKVRVASDHFTATPDAIVEEVQPDHAPNSRALDDPGHWLYRIKVTAGEVPNAAMNTIGEIWVCDFEVTKLPTREESEPCTPQL